MKEHILVAAPVPHLFNLSHYYILNVVRTRIFSGSSVLWGREIFQWEKMAAFSLDHIIRRCIDLRPHMITTTDPRNFISQKRIASSAGVISNEVRPSLGYRRRCRLEKRSSVVISIISCRRRKFFMTVNPHNQVIYLLWSTYDKQTITHPQRREFQFH